MVKWRIVYTRQAQKDAKKIAAAGLRQKAEKLLGREVPRKPYLLGRVKGHNQKCYFSSGKPRPLGEELHILSGNPFQTPPPFEKLIGDLSGAYSRRITIQHRLVYQVLQEIKTVKVIRMWTHYE
jgi:Txe/YoeB family toxin of toxin-antitoxin system